MGAPHSGRAPQGARPESRPRYGLRLDKLKAYGKLLSQYEKHRC
jgi:hypothetical protein